MTAVNKKALAIVALATSVFAIAGCSDAEATPKFYEDAIINGEVTHNVMSVLYDALCDSSSNSQKVLDKVIEMLADDYFGKWEEVEPLAAKTASDADVKAFMGDHKEFYSLDNDEKNFKRLQNFVKDLQERITESYYDEISNGSYSYRNRFEEKKYAAYLKSQMYTVEKDGEYYSNVLITKDYKDNLEGALHVNWYKDYTNRYLIKKFYKNLLVEEYMFNENYSLLGRSYARQINYVALPTNSEYPGAAKNLLVAYSDQYLEQAYTFTDDLVDFSIIEKAWNGLPSDVAYTTEEANQTEVQKLLDAAGFETKSVTYNHNGASVTETYYPATKYGAMVEKYAKITSDRNTTKNESDFTGSNTYPKEVGYGMECDSIALNSYTTDGWYIKTNSTSLPTDLNTRLFNIGVANDVDHFEGASRTYELGDYVAKKNGKYWLVPATSEKGDNYNYVIYDSSSSTYYMVQVVEAASTSKLSTNADNTNSYAKLRGDDMLAEKIAREIAKQFNSNDTYKNNAYYSYLEKYGILFYDQEIYDYFEEKYPDLFDDED